MSAATSVFNQPKPVVSLDPALLEAINSGIRPYPIPSGRVYGYGTAGVSKQSLANKGRITDVNDSFA